MTDNQLINVTKKLIAIESTAENPPGLRQAYEFLVDMLRSSGKNITIEEFESNGKPSFIAYKGKRPAKFHIIFSVHADVVPGKKHQFKATVKDGKLYGRGVYDEKAACVILADLFCEYVDKVPYALAFQVVTDEEVGGRDGVQLQIQQYGVRGNFVICAECGRHPNEHEIANEAKGATFITVSFTGSAAHGAYPWRGSNAATKAANFITSLHQKFPAPLEASAETTFTVTSLSASGGAMNTVPDFATLRLDIRYTSDDPNFKDAQHATALLQSIEPEAGIDIEFFDPPMYCNPNNKLLQALKASAEEIEKTSFSFVRRHATSDGRHFGAAGDEACEFGVAGEHQHGDDEHVTLEAFSNYRKTMRHFLNQTIDESQPLATQPNPQSVKNLIPA